MDRVSQRLTAQGSGAVLPCHGAAARNTYMTRPLVHNCDGYQVATANIALDDCQGLIFWQLGTCFILQHKRGYAFANLISVWEMSSIFFNTKLKDRLFYLQKKWLEHRKSLLNLSLDIGLDEDWLCFIDTYSFQNPLKNHSSKKIKWKNLVEIVSLCSDQILSLDVHTWGFNLTASLHNQKASIWAQNLTHRCRKTSMFDVADFYPFRRVASGPESILTRWDWCIWHIVVLLSSFLYLEMMNLIAVCITKWLISHFCKGYLLKIHLINLVQWQKRSYRSLTADPEATTV